MDPVDNVIIVTRTPAKLRSGSSPEICEHKGIGHPDSICDGVAEAVSRALCRQYLRAQGEIQHYNVDKALLVGGESTPRFGGGRVSVPIRLIVAGRATPVRGVEMGDLVEGAARSYLASTLHCDPAIFRIETAIGPGSGSLCRVFSPRGAVPVANDTSVGAGYAPYSPLDQMVLKLAAAMRSSQFRSRFPAAGDDYKIMGAYFRQRVRFTIALAFIDQEVADASRYFAIKAEAARYLENTIDAPGAIELNTLDSADATSEDGLYLTVTGLSAERGDDGQVGRGNRVNRLITPCRPMSLEAAAGKNPVAHVGKIYNVLAAQIAHAIRAEVGGVAQVSVRILSAIGRPITQPQLVAIEVAMEQGRGRIMKAEIRKLVRSHLERVGQVSEKLIRGELEVF